MFFGQHLPGPWQCPIIKTSATETAAQHLPRNPNLDQMSLLCWHRVCIGYNPDAFLALEMQQVVLHPTQTAVGSRGVVGFARPDNVEGDSGLTRSNVHFSRRILLKMLSNEAAKRFGLF
jgi:hypothetical protein